MRVEAKGRAFLFEFLRCLRVDLRVILLWVLRRRRMREEDIFLLSNSSISEKRTGKPSFLVDGDPLLWGIRALIRFSRGEFDSFE